MAKKLKPSEQLHEQINGIRETVKRWQNHAAEGCSDPAWSDGVNMNLLRNHLFYYKQRIKELCEEHSLILPEEVYFPDLPYVDNNYFAKPDSERAQRIMSRPGWQCRNQENPQKPIYEIGQMSLF